MTPRRTERIPGWLDDLEKTLDEAHSLATRGRDSYESDAALPLAFEALCARVGEIAKRLVDADPVTFSDETWSLAAKQRDLVAHHYDRIDRIVLWNTVSTGFPQLRPLIAAARG